MEKIIKTAGKFFEKLHEMIMKDVQNGKIHKNYATLVVGKSEVKMMENLSYYPNEIAEKLCFLANMEGEEKTKRDCTEALYHILEIAQNPYNSDYYRVLYKVLEEITGMDE